MSLPVLPPWPTDDGVGVIAEVLQHASPATFKPEDVKKCSFVPAVWNRESSPTVVFLFSIARPPTGRYPIDARLGIRPMPWHLDHLMGDVFSDRAELERAFEEGAIAALQVRQGPGPSASADILLGIINQTENVVRMCVISDLLDLFAGSATRSKIASSPCSPAPSAAKMST